MPTMPANETRGKCSILNVFSNEKGKIAHTNRILSSAQIRNKTFNQNQNVLFHVNMKHYSLGEIVCFCVPVLCSLHYPSFPKLYPKFPSFVFLWNSFLFAWKHSNTWYSIHCKTRAHFSCVHSMKTKQLNTQI